MYDTYISKTLNISQIKLKIMFSFKGVEEQSNQSGLDNWKKNQEKINILLHQYNAKKILTPEQEILLSKIHDLPLEFEGSCQDLVEKCGMKKLFRTQGE